MFKNVEMGRSFLAVAHAFWLLRCFQPASKGGGREQEIKKEYQNSTVSESYREGLVEFDAGGSRRMGNTCVMLKDLLLNDRPHIQWRSKNNKEALIEVIRSIASVYTIRES